MAQITATVAEAKARMSRARDLARKADPLSAALFDRWYAETLMSARGVPAEVACTMQVRMAIVLEVMAERTGWAAGVVAGLTSPRRASRPA
jgi:hypothetical protein